MNWLQKQFIKLAFTKPERIVMKICHEKILQSMEKMGTTRTLDEAELLAKEHVINIISKL